jgi:hypothetical protein
MDTAIKKALTAMNEKVAKGRDDGPVDNKGGGQSWASPSTRRNSIQLARSLDRNINRRPSNRLTNQIRKISRTILLDLDDYRDLSAKGTLSGDLKKGKTTNAPAISGVTASGILRRYGAAFGEKVSSSNSLHLLKQISWVKFIYAFSRRQLWIAQFLSGRTEAKEQSGAAAVIQRRIRAKKEEELNLLAKIFKKECAHHAMRLVLYGRSVRRRLASVRARWFFATFSKLNCATVFRRFRTHVIRGQRAARAYLDCGKARLKLMSMIWLRFEIQMMTQAMKGDVQDNLQNMRRQSQDLLVPINQTKRARGKERSSSSMKRVSTERMRQLHKKWGVIQNQSRNLLDDAAQNNRVPASVRRKLLKATLLRYRRLHIAEEYPKYTAKKEEYLQHLQKKDLFGGCMDSFEQTHSRLAQALALVDRQKPMLPVLFMFSRLVDDLDFVQSIQTAVDEHAKKSAFGDQEGGEVEEFPA